jgi:hypothetical protein
MTIRAQDGGHGGKGTDNSIPTSIATGGSGGRGGEIRFISTGSLSFDGTADIQTGAGGNGGDADAKPPQNPLGAKAPGARATGGSGGPAGLFSVKTGGPIVFPAPGAQTITIGKSGDGGKAFAEGAAGVDAGTLPAQHGGDARVDGGPGADTPDKTLRGSNISGNLVLAGGDAGDGGLASPKAGKGGNGNAANLPGANAGEMDGDGGPGGAAQLKDLQGNIVGKGGNGGQRILRNKSGGDGGDHCEPDDIGPGGPGGQGSVAKGEAGKGGPGNPHGADGTTSYTDIGVGGDGGNGAPSGAPGKEGINSITGKQSPSGTNFKPGGQRDHCATGDYFGKVDIDSDPHNHDPFTRYSKITKIKAMVAPDGKTVAFKPSTLDPNNPDNARWVSTSGPRNSSGGFTTSGVGDVALRADGPQRGATSDPAFLIPNVPVIFVGILTDDGRLGGIITIPGPPLPNGPVRYRVTMTKVRP